MKALIFNGEVIELNETGFPVAPALTWVDCSPEVEVNWTYSNGTFSAPTVVTKSAPKVVSMRQARLALLNAGLLSTVNTAVAAMTGDAGEAARIEWEYATEVNRDKELVQSLALALSLTETQLDDLFTAAAAL
jgi:hypothetical protein